MSMFAISILFAALLLMASWAGGCSLYDRQTKTLIREARRLRRYNNVMERTTPERAEREQDDGNKV